MKRDPSFDVLPGTLELLILKTLSISPRHGWSISRRIRQISEEALSVGQGSLYPALQRLVDKGWIASAWEESEDGRPAKIYRITAAGRRALARQTESWRSYVRHIELILNTTS